MKRSKIIVFLLLIVAAYSGNAQTLFLSANQQLVEQAIKGSMFVLKQAYQLEDSVSGQRFGRYGNDVFGTSSALAVRTSEGVLVDSDVFKPWSNDENYVRYQNTHIPVLSNTSKIEFGDSIWNVLTLIQDSVYNHHSKLSLLTDSLRTNAGLVMKQYDKPVEGWIVWVSNDSVIGKYKGKNLPDLTIFKKTIEFTPDSISYNIDKPQMSKKIWGGIFIVPEQIDFGVIRFNLAAVLLDSKENDTWTLNKTVIRKEESSDSNDELTPLSTSQTKKNSKKKKK